MFCTSRKWLHLLTMYWLGCKFSLRITPVFFELPVCIGGLCLSSAVAGELLSPGISLVVVDWWPLLSVLTITRTGGFFLRCSGVVVTDAVSCGDTGAGATSRVTFPSTGSEMSTFVFQKFFIAAFSHTECIFARSVQCTFLFCTQQLCEVICFR